MKLRSSLIGLVIVVNLLAATVLAACADGNTADVNVTTNEPVTLRLLTHDSFTPTETIFDDFTLQTGIKVELVRNSDAGTLVTKAVLASGNPEGDVLQVTLPATSIFGKEEGEKRPLQAYARYMAAQTPPVNLDAIVTRMKFDTKAESPKLIFAPVRWLTDDEYEIVQTQSTSKDAEKAVSSTPAAVDGVTAPAPLAIEGKRPVTKPMGELLEEEAPAPKAKKAKAVEVEAEEEPEVRKAPAKVEAAPAKKNKLADIVADWDDE